MADMAYEGLYSTSVGPKSLIKPLYNDANKIAYEILKEEGRNVIPCLRNARHLEDGFKVVCSSTVESERRAVDKMKAVLRLSYQLGSKLQHGITNDCSFLSSFLPNPRHRLAAHGLAPQKCVSKHISCSTTTPTYSTTVPRRSRHYKPSIWDYDFVQLLVSDYKVETYATRVEELKEDVKHLLKETDSYLAQIELIDNLHSLGVRWLFEIEITQALYTISLDNTNIIEIKGDLHAVSTRFRLLRQHGHKKYGFACAKAKLYINIYIYT
ncbi:Geraniol synthase, chloroplastic [Cinnamomum micranthum f. kanehirae]|uniref:Geraniol synthase, chloroplastic n=1 Tax=Cinnamomum micranthum f. kanehirae TaxID=337451 RepID=A0A3S3PLT6_9MAGN|nr:Geraniol synthase, chloroplastic [Cinnamomum micranthum f. kanehirae]